MTKCANCIVCVKESPNCPLNEAGQVKKPVRGRNGAGRERAGVDRRRDGIGGKGSGRPNKGIAGSR